MIPEITKEDNPDALLLSIFNYAELDKSSHATRVRLSSTVVNVKHSSLPNNSSDVLVNYIKENQSYQVKGKNVVMACYNMMIPHIVFRSSRRTSLGVEASGKMPFTIHERRV